MVFGTFWFKIKSLLANYSLWSLHLFNLTLNEIIGTYCIDLIVLYRMLHLNSALGIIVSQQTVSHCKYCKSKNISPRLRFNNASFLDQTKSLQKWFFRQFIQSQVPQHYKTHEFYCVIFGDRFSFDTDSDAKDVCEFKFFKSFVEVFFSLFASCYISSFLFFG